MAITYNIDSLAVKPREAYEKVTEGALGLVSHDEMDAIINTLRHPKGHIAIEIRTGAYTAEEMAALDASYEHLCKMRDEIISLGIIPAVADWATENPNL